MITRAQFRAMSETLHFGAEHQRTEASEQAGYDFDSLHADYDALVAIAKLAQEICDRQDEGESTTWQIEEMKELLAARGAGK